MLGALLTITTTALVGILLVNRVIEVIQMNDPIVQVYSRSIYKKEVDSLGEINLDQHHFNIGLQVYYEKYDDSLQKYIKIPFQIPANVGRFAALIDIDPYTERTYNPFINCTDVFKDVNEEFGEREQKALNNGYCVDPTAETSII